MIPSPLEPVQQMLNAVPSAPEQVNEQVAQFRYAERHLPAWSFFSPCAQEGQHHPQNEPEHWHRARLPLYRQGFLYQLLETKLFKHRGHRKQSSVGGQIPRIEVIGRGSPDLIRFRNICANPLIHRLAASSMICIAHHLGVSCPGELSSRPVELHHQPLTAPCLILSHHTALHGD